MKCVYEEGKFIIKEVDDGNYILIANGIDDFSLYPAENFGEVEARLSNRISAYKDETAKRAAIFIFANAESLVIDDGIVSLSEYSMENVCSNEFEVKRLNTHFRLIGKNIAKEQIDEYDIIEKMINEAKNMVIHVIDKKDIMYTDILSKYITLKLKIFDKEKNILILRCDKLRFYEIEDIEYEKDGYSIVIARPSINIDGITVSEMEIFQEHIKNIVEQGQVLKEASNELKEIVSDVVDDVIEKQQSLTQEESGFLRNIIASENFDKNKQFLDMTDKIISQYTEKEKKIYKDFANELIKKKQTRLINLICCCKINRLDYEKLHLAVEEAGVSVDYGIRRRRGIIHRKWEDE